MKLPQGGVWQRMRQRALDAIPLGAHANLRAPVNLATWQEQGSYTISATSTSRFTVTASPIEFGEALLSDSSFHLDHAAEQHATIMKMAQPGQWVSPAWLVVTFYYWSYFSAMSLSRMLGNSVWFVRPETAQQFTRLAPPGMPKVQQGTYEIECLPSSLGMRDISLTKRPRRLHEQLWETTFGVLRDIHSEAASTSSSSQEERLYLAILQTSDVLGNDWPSSFRNYVNYRPGFAYTAPRFISSIGSLSYLAAERQSIATVLDRMENDTIEMRNSGSQVHERPKTVARMLADLSLLLALLSRSLHEEIIDRHGADRRWQLSRRRFCEQQGLLASGDYWPL